MLSFKPLIYVAVLLSLAGMRWRITPGRAIVYAVIAIATIVYFATLDRTTATLASVLVPLGLFCAPQVKKPPRVEHRLALWGALALIVYCYFFTNAFDADDGVVSHNFIAIVGLYMLMLCTLWRRIEILMLCFSLTIMMLVVGSRSGAAVLLIVSLYVVSPRAAVSIALACAALYFSGFTIDTLPDQFTRNYEGGTDPRFFIWTEFFEHAIAGSLFRRDDFDFMVTFGLDRNFHNSVLEAYYRLGPFVMVLLALHLGLLKSVGDNRVAFVVFAALLAKGLFDTFLWFTPIDVLIFREYGSILFGGRESRNRKLNRNLPFTAMS